MNVIIDIPVQSILTPKNPGGTQSGSVFVRLFFSFSRGFKEVHESFLNTNGGCRGNVQIQD